MYLRTKNQVKRKKRAVPLNAIGVMNSFCIISQRGFSKKKTKHFGPKVWQLNLIVSAVVSSLTFQFAKNKKEFLEGGKPK